MIEASKNDIGRSVFDECGRRGVITMVRPDAQVWIRWKGERQADSVDSDQLSWEEDEQSSLNATTKAENSDG